jgi:signal transduction histidine kinase
MAFHPPNEGSISAMAAGQDRTRRPGLGGRIAAAELALVGIEVVLCGVPVALWVRTLAPATGQRLVRIGLPLLAAAVVALTLRVEGALRPVAAVMAAKLRQQPVSPAQAEAVQQTLRRTPAESAAVRALLWLGVAAIPILVAAGGRGDARVAAGFASVLAVHGVAVGALRALILDRVLERLRPQVLASVEGIRVFAFSYRRNLAWTGVAVFGVAHAALALLVRCLVAIEGRALALVGILIWPTLAVAVPLWARSLRRRTRSVEEYLEATVRSPGNRGPARDEPRAVPAFVAAQELPYRLAAYLAFILALAGVAAVAVARRLGALDVGSAARLLGCLAVVTLGALGYAVLVLRRTLAPLMRHIGSRHFLPVARIRSRVGLRAKLLACSTIVVAVACGTLDLYHLAPAGMDGAAGVLTLFVMVGGALGLTFLAVDEVVQPIQALEERSEEMTRGELARPVPPSGEADEIGRLMVAFEEMRRSLRDRLRSTESINIDLEREVRRRTEALEQRNTDLREALDKLRHAQDELIRSEKLASMGRLVAGIAHEINNPVNAVINSLGPLEEILRQIRGASEDPDATALARSAEEMLAVVQRGAARTKAIVQALHNYSRGDDAIPREVNLARSVEDSLDLLRHRLRNVTVTKEIDPAARIVGLPGQIDQVLMNLLINAAQALGERGGTIAIQVARAGEAVHVSVSDDGPGIPADVLPRIFDPFFTTKDVGEGSGLGLSIVHGIVERHGGHISVRSAPGLGTTFTVTFGPPARNAAAS